jgi:addiction module HigA family antidote
MVMTGQRKKLAPTHPGELLRSEVMPAAKLTQEKLAILLGVSRRTVNEIVTEKRSLSADMAHRLARLFNTTPELWLGLQQDVDLWKAAEAGVADYRKIKPLRRKVA